LLVGASVSGVLRTWCPRRVEAANVKTRISTLAFHSAQLR